MAAAVITRKIVLGKSADWDMWFHYVKQRAINNFIWELVDPSKDIKPAVLVAPVKPTVTIPTGPEKLGSDAYEIFRIRQQIYKDEVAEYKDQHKALADLVAFIQETVAVQYSPYISKAEPHPWDLLRSLKSRLAPSDQARKLEVLRRYQALCLGPGSRDIESWIEEWQLTYTEAAGLKIGEALEERPKRDFLLAIRLKNATFAEMHLEDVDKDSVTIYHLIELYRNRTRLLKAADIIIPTHSAFGAHKEQTEKGKGKEKESTFNGQKPARPKCLCGGFHSMGKCWFMVPNIRPSGWTPNAATMTRVSEALKDPANRKKLSESIERLKKAESEATTWGGEEGDTDHATFVTNSVFAVDEKFSIRNSWILDNGSDIHVCNDTMLHRFRKEKNAPSNHTLIAGARRCTIEAYGTIKITADSPTGPKEITLQNVAYVPDFMTNVTSLFLMRKKGVHFDSWKSHLHAAGKTLYLVKQVGGHDLLEDNTSAVFITRRLKDTSNPTEVPTKKKVASSYDWHRLLAHASAEVIGHLQSSAQGVEVTDSAKINVPKTNECEPCALSKAHRIISRSTELAETSDKPFYRVTFDLIPMTPALNKDEWISHFACHSTDFNMVYTHQKKSEATKLIREAFNVIETRFNGKIVFVRSDGEKSPGIEFISLLAEKGISWEPSAPASPEQNGHSERQGGILTMKARALRIDADLPTFLWNEIIRTAGYLANRTPMAKHGWKTPWELVAWSPPNLAHLHQFGCKAYTLNKNIPREQKLEARAHIGHLVGYEARTIFRIWIPSQAKSYSHTRCYVQ